MTRCLNSEQAGSLQDPDRVFATDLAIRPGALRDKDARAAEAFVADPRRLR
jgi:hypothetical protein